MSINLAVRATGKRESAFGGVKREHPSEPESSNLHVIGAVDYGADNTLSKNKFMETRWRTAQRDITRASHLEIEACPSL